MLNIKPTRIANGATILIGGLIDFSVGMVVSIDTSLAIAMTAGIHSSYAIRTCFDIGTDGEHSEHSSKHSDHIREHNSKHSEHTALRCHCHLLPARVTHTSRESEEL